MAFLLSSIRAFSTNNKGTHATKTSGVMLPVNGKASVKSKPDKIDKR